MRPIACAPPPSLSAPVALWLRGTAFARSVGPADEEAGRLLEPVSGQKLCENEGRGSGYRGCESGEKRERGGRLGEPDVCDLTAVAPHASRARPVRSVARPRRGRRSRSSSASVSETDGSSAAARALQSRTSTTVADC